MGFGNIQEFLSADSGLRERAHRAEIQETSIAHLPTWEISMQTNDGSVHAPLPGWRSTASRTNSSQPTLHRPPPYQLGNLWSNSLKLTQYLASAGAHLSQFTSQDLETFGTDISRYEDSDEDKEYDEDEDDEIPPLEQPLVSRVIRCYHNFKTSV